MFWRFWFLSKTTSLTPDSWKVSTAHWVLHEGRGNLCSDNEKPHTSRRGVDQCHDQSWHSCNLPGVARQPGVANRLFPCSKHQRNYMKLHCLQYKLPTLRAGSLKHIHSYTNQTLWATLIIHMIYTTHNNFDHLYDIQWRNNFNHIYDIS